jgi:sugar phosphate isomerase/epimerase
MAKQVCHDTGWTRRQFVAGCLATTLATSVRAAHANALLEGDSPVEFKMGAQSYTWREFSLDKALAQMKELGLGYVEFATGHVPLTSTDAQLAAVRRLCAENDVIPAAAGVFPFSKDTDENRKVFEFGRKLGVKSLSANPTPDAFDSLDKLCEEYQISIGIHPHGPVGNQLHSWYSAEIILAAVKDHHPLIGSCLDTGHLIRCAQPPFEKKLDPAEQILIMGKRNFGIHLKDHDNAKREDVIFGQGSLDVASVFKALKAVGYTNALSIEYEAHPENPSPDVAACLEVAREKAATI